MGAVYAPAFGNRFVTWDDDSYIYENAHIKKIDAEFFRWSFLEFYESNWDPLTWLSHALDYMMFGLNPAGHHFTSILIHCLNTLLFMAVTAWLLEHAARRSSHAWSDEDRLWAAAISGLLFGLYPIHVESVAWVSERKDVLYSFFYLLAVVSYLRYASSPSAEGRSLGFAADRRYAAVIFFFVCSLLSKPMAVTLPAALLILDWYPLERLNLPLRNKFVIAEKIPMLILSAAASAIAVAAQKSGKAIATMQDAPLGGRVALAFKSLLSYLYKILFPASLSPYYRYPKKMYLSSPDSIAAVCAAAAITIFAVFLIRKSKMWFAAWLFFVATLFPVLGMVQFGSHAMADRFAYMASAALLMPAAAGIVWAANRTGMNRARKNMVVAATAASICLALAVVTVRQTRIWESGVTLWSTVIEANPDLAIAYFNRGKALEHDGRTEEAIQDYTRAIESGKRAFNTSVGLYYYNRGCLLGRQGRFLEALTDITRAIWMSLAPNGKYYISRASVYDSLERYDEALADYSEALRLMPYSPEAYNGRGIVLIKKGRPDDALRDFLAAVNSAGADRAGYLRNLAEAYKKLGRKRDPLNFRTAVTEVSPSILPACPWRA